MRPAGAPGLHLIGLSVGYRDGRRSRTVVGDLDITARPGELTALIGPNGTGKSTLLRTLAGLQPALAGNILLDGQQLDRMRPQDRARAQAIVLTERVAPGRLTAREMVALGRHPHTGFLGRLTPEDHRLVDDALVAVGASPLADRDLSELSDGERQRVMTARALAQQPRLLLMDEPSAFLDAPGRVALTGLVRRIAVDQGRVAVISTHEVELALQVADRIWLLDRNGALHAGTPEELMFSGRLGEVFDSEDLTFDPERGSFSLVGPDAGAVLVSGEAGPALDHLLRRRGWRSAGPEGPASVEIRVCGPDCWDLLHGGKAHRADTSGDLARVLAGPLADAGLARVGPVTTGRAVAAAAHYSSYFEVTLGDSGTALDDLSDAALHRWSDRTADRIGSDEPRVGASTWEFGLVARLWSVLIGSWAEDGVIPDLSGVGVEEVDGQLRLTLAVTGGWLDEAAEPTLVAATMARQVHATTDQLHGRLRVAIPLSLKVLEGNRAAAAIGAVRAVQRHPGGRDTAPLLAALLKHPIVADHVQQPPDGDHVRTSCCLYYRVGPDAGTCGDCPLGERAKNVRRTGRTTTPAGVNDGGAP